MKNVVPAYFSEGNDVPAWISRELFKPVAVKAGRKASRAAAKPQTGDAHWET